MANAESPNKPFPPCEITRSGQSSVVFAENSDEFRVACAAEAVAQATILLSVLKREYKPEEQSNYDFCVVFENTMRRVKELLDSVNIGPGRDSLVQDDDIANVVFGGDWLVGQRLADGRIVAA